MNDQMKLLQMTWAELLTLQLAYRSIPYSGKLIFAKEFWLDERTAKACGALDLFNHVRNQMDISLISFRRNLPANALTFTILRPFMQF